MQSQMNCCKYNFHNVDLSDIKKDKNRPSMGFIVIEINCFGQLEIFIFLFLLITPNYLVNYYIKKWRVRVIVCY